MPKKDGSVLIRIDKNSIPIDCKYCHFVSMAVNERGKFFCPFTKKDVSDLALVLKIDKDCPFMEVE